MGQKGEKRRTHTFFFFISLKWKARKGVAFNLTTMINLLKTARSSAAVFLLR